MNIDLSQFVGVFFEETAEHLAEMEHLLLAIDSDTPDADQLNSIFRAAHSIKGSAGVFGFQALTSVTHVLENLLDKLRNGSMALQPGMIDSFLTAVDTLKAIAAAYRSDTAPDMAAANTICERLEQFSQQPAPVTLKKSGSTGKKASTSTEAAAYGLFTEPVRPVEAYGFFNEPAASIGSANTAEDADGYGFFAPLPATPADSRDSSDAYGLFEPSPVPSAAVSGNADDSFGLFEPLPSKPASNESGSGALEQYVAKVLEPAASNAQPAAAQDSGLKSARADSKPAAAALPPSAAPANAVGKKPDVTSAESTTIRVNTEKIDQIINLVGELVITQSMLAQTASELVSAGSERLNDRMKTLERNTRDLQEAVMSIRMMPVSFIFNRFPRVVRDLAQKLGKQVDLIIEGEGTELDKGLIEKLADPLTHLVRNSIDHGIEMPERRAAAGKPERGSIRLSAFQRSGSIVIEVTDDGGGLRRDKILAKARERGVPVHEDMPDSEVWQLIFAPGFSTADQVTDVSGRGVGMDVVKRNIQEIGGRIEIQSAEGRGSTMSIRLPLTLAILDGMVIAVGAERFVIPLVFISESLQPRAEDMRSITGSGQVVMVRADYIPLCALHQHMNITPKYTDPTQGLLVVLENEGGRIALLVDELLGQQQVVIKSLESNYRRVDSVAGATIMGDGRVALILNIEQLIQRYGKPGLAAASTAQRGAA